MARRDSGFTLIEVVCVVALIALIASVLLPSPISGTSRAGVEQLARRTAALLDSDRYAAIRNRMTYGALVDLRARRIRSGHASVELVVPGDVDIATTVADSCGATRELAAFLFYPDGGACGGTLYLSRGSVHYEVRVNWLTGGVEVVSVPTS